MPDMREHYNGGAMYGQPREASVFGPPESMLTKFLDEHPELEIRTAADLCCGDGRHTFYLAEKGIKIVAADYSTEAVKRVQERAESKGLRNIIVREMDLIEITLKPESVDLAICVISLHEFDAKGAEHIIQQSKAATKPGGINYHAFFIKHTGTYMKGDGYYPNHHTIRAHYNDWEILKEISKIQMHCHVTPDSGRKEVSHMHDVYHLFAQKPS